MNIVTIFEYDLSKPQYMAMLYMFLDSVKKSCQSNPYTIYIVSNKSKMLKSIFRNSNITFIEAIPSKKKSHFQNIEHKLHYLCNLKMDFIYLDCDTYVNADLYYLWERRKDKPYIGVIHQPDIIGFRCNHTTDVHFLNSGLQIISDPLLMDYNKLYDYGASVNFQFAVSGTDQALLDGYFKKINYDYTHPDIGYSWNSCAGYSVCHTDDGYNYHIQYKNKDTTYAVNINHYWDEFRHWKINCPIYKNYEAILSTMV